MKKYSFLLLFLLMTTLTVSAQNIFRTACQGNLPRLDSLLSQTALDSVDARGRTLLHWAVACEEAAVFDYLIDKGIAINVADNEGATPLHMAVRYTVPQLVDSLLALQSNSDWATNYGGELLEHSLINKDLTMIKTLIAKGVNVNSTNKRGSTALEISKRLHTQDISAWLLANGADESLVRTVELTGDYLGQEKPGLAPKLFAPNFISTEESEFGSVLNRAGDEFYYGVDVKGKTEIRLSKRAGNSWSAPITILEHEKYGYNDPFLSPDENRLYFISERALDGVGESKDHDIWYVLRQRDGWSAPINAGPNINSDGNEYYISFTNDGTMYFASNVNAHEERKRSDHDIYYSKWKNGQFQEAVALGDSINTQEYEADVFVNLEETYLIFCSTRAAGQGRGDLYISFKNATGTWSKAISMGDKINSAKHELCPFVTNDGQYLFYTSNQDIYWVSAAIIDELRKEVLFNK